MSDITEIDYLPLDLPETSTGAGDLLSENIARIELLKMKVLELASLSEFEKGDFLRELDVLRGSFFQARSFMGHAAHERPEADAVSSMIAGADPENLQIEGIIGQNRQITQTLKIISKVAPTDLTILLEGETGVGKELFARIIHLNSKRKKFVAVNCGAFPADIIESELFGHSKGAFTGASSERKGKFEEADDGTIFLDEIGDLELHAQVKLLRVLEVGEIQRVGSEKTAHVDVKVIAATNKNLEEMVRDGEFREDLYYRINMCPLWIPPLRERRDEIEILFEYFLKEACAAVDKKAALLDRELQEFIYKRYEFPGNIRELRNIAHYIAYIADDQAVSLVDLPARYQRWGGKTPAADQDANKLNHVRSDAERSYLIDVMTKHHGNIKKICEEMKLSRSRVYQLLTKFELQASDYR
ncbi:MAG: sigma-54 interaction domain-containing protein [Gammaproteobacteria bacterium]